MAESDRTASTRMAMCSSRPANAKCRVPPGAAGPVTMVVNQRRRVGGGDGTELPLAWHPDDELLGVSGGLGGGGFGSSCPDACPFSAGG